MKKYLPKSEAVQKLLDKFYWFRKRVVTLITFASIRLFGSEVKWGDMWNEKFISSQHTDRDLSKAGDLPLLLAEAKESLKNADSRRAGIADKCKTLLLASNASQRIISQDPIWSTMDACPIFPISGDPPERRHSFGGILRSADRNDN